MCSVNASPSLTHANTSPPIDPISPSSSDELELAGLLNRGMRSAFTTDYLNTERRAPTCQGKVLIRLEAGNNSS